MAKFIDTQTRQNHNGFVSHRTEHPMNNPHIEALIFAAETLDGKPVECRFLEIGRIDTIEDRFDYRPTTALDAIPCRYSSLRLLEPEQVFEARLQALAWGH
jgi:hypothetical protein